METLRNDTVHTPDSISSLSYINTHINELSKEKEEELLYGAGDDGDEEDALSDDSIRLRLSDDDEIESENVLTDVVNNQQNKSQNSNIDVAKSEDVNPSNLEKNVVQKNMTVNEINKKEDYSGDVSLDEKMVTGLSKDIKANDIEITRSPIINMPRRPNYEPQWRFTNSSNIRSFRGVHHPHYNRYRYSTPRGHYRLQAYDYNSRYHNNFLPFEQARNCGKFNSYNTLPYNNRQQKRGFKPNIISRNYNNGSSESYPNLASSSHTNTSRTEVDNDVIVVSTNTTNINEKDISDNISDNECLIINENNDDKSHELPNKKVESISSNTGVCKGSQVDSNCVNDSLKSEHEIKLTEENPSPIDDKCTNVSITETDTCKENLINSHNSNEHPEKTNTSNTTTAIDIDREEVQHVDNVCASDKTEVNTNEEVDQHVELSENRDKDILNNLEEKLIVNNEVIINGEIKNDDVKEVCKKQDEDVFVQNMKSNEDDKYVINTNSIIVNDLTNDKNDNEIKVVEDDVSVKSVVKNGVCDNDQLKSNDSTKLNEEVTSEEQLTHSENDLQVQTVNAAEENAQCKEKENSQTYSTNSTIKLSDIIESVLDRDNLFKVKSQKESLDFATDVKVNSDTDKTTDEVTVATQRKKKRTRKTIVGAAEDANEEDKQAKESGRQKRQTAKNAEEIIRKKFLNHDSDLESSDDSEKFVAVNHKMNQDVCPSSPPSLKRNYSNVDSTTLNGNVKKIKISPQDRSEQLISRENNSHNIKDLNYVHKFFQRDLKEKLPKLKQEELEELLIQKIVETITMRGEIGKLREQARISERNQEATRQKCQQLAKQIKDFEMVLSRNAADRRANNDKPVPPIKINRSVGLQVNFITDHGMQNLRQLQQSSNMKALQISNNSNASNIPNNETNNTTSPRKGIKIRSPRRTEPINAQAPVVSQNHTQSPNILPTVPAAPLVVTKPVDIQHNLTLPIQSTVQMISNQQIQPQPTQQTIVLNGKLPNRQSTVTANIAQTRTNDLIDLTDEEEKSKAVSAPVSTSTISESQINLPQNPQPCFQRVIQTIPGNVAISSQPPSIRVVQPASQPTPTALVNNMNAPRLTYVMQSGVGPTRQLLITPNSTPMRPVTSCNRTSFPTVTYKTGISTVANGTVRVLTTPATTNLQLPKHPAPLPDTRNYVANPLWKLPPPAPSLKISKVANGIVLSWNMNLSDKYADIASYQLYAYQEITGIPPNTSLWKKVGDVRALPLPMACTLTQFSEGNNYYFAVRAVDTHSRKGQYSIPSNISL